MKQLKELVPGVIGVILLGFLAVLARDFFPTNGTDATTNSVNGIIRIVILFIPVIAAVGLLYYARG